MEHKNNYTSGRGDMCSRHGGILEDKYRLHTEVQVSTRFILPRAAGPRWYKKRRDQTEMCNQLVPWPMML